jgi:hypothetical protein
MRVNFVHAFLFWLLGAATFWLWQSFISPKLGG